MAKPTFRRPQLILAAYRPPPVVLLVWFLSVLIAFLFGKGGSNSHCDSDNYGQTASVFLPQIEHRKVKEISNQKSDNRNNDGWSSIDVFIGDPKHLDKIDPPEARDNPKPRAVQQWYAQVHQDKVVAVLFNNKKNGFFIDLAANDARTLSNTFALERHFDWSGLCVEPNPIYWHDLSYRKCQVVAAVVGRQRMEEVSFNFADVMGGIVRKDFDNKRSMIDEPPTQKYTVPLLEILQRYDVPKTIDYLSLDVEGAEEYIFSIFPLDEYTIHIMTVERPNDGLKKYMEENGFQMVLRLSKWGETLWAHETFLQGEDIGSLKKKVRAVIK